MQFARLGQTGQQAYIHGRRAKLEGENAPGEVKCNAVFIGETKIDNFIDLQNNYDDGGGQDHLPLAVSRMLFMPDAKHNAKDKTADKKQQMKPSIRFGCGHRPVQDPKHRCKKVHLVTSRKSFPDYITFFDKRNLRFP